MTDLKSLPNDHPLKPLETRMLEMVSDMGPLRVQGGNFVAALRVFADERPGLVDLTHAEQVPDLVADICCAVARSKHPTLHEAGDCWEVFDDTDSATGEDYRGIRQRYPARAKEVTP